MVGKRKKISQPDSIMEGSSSDICTFYLNHKKRFCRMLASKGKKYCGQHMVAESSPDEEGRIRVPCPLDPKHSVYSHIMDQHLKVCNARAPVDLPYYCKDVNAQPPDVDNENYTNAAENPEAIKQHISLGGRTLAELSDAELMQLIAHVKNHAQSHADPVQDADLSHSSVVPETEISPLSGPSYQKHFLQNRSLVARLGAIGGLGGSKQLGAEAPNGVERMVDGSLPQHDKMGSQLCFLEFGAGRGELSHHVVRACDSSQQVQVVLIDRGAQRYKFDTKIREGSNVSTKRLRLDIADLALERVPGLMLGGRVYAGGKHLCGAATDLTLRCLNRLQLFQARSQNDAQDQKNLAHQNINSTTFSGNCNAQEIHNLKVDISGSNSVSNLVIKSDQHFADNLASSSLFELHDNALSIDQTSTREVTSKASDMEMKCLCRKNNWEAPENENLSSHCCCKDSLANASVASCGLVIALCCHHKCSWQHYTGKRFFKRIGLSGAEFTAVMGLTSWAVCAARPPAADSSVPAATADANRVHVDSSDVYYKASFATMDADEVTVVSSDVNSKVSYMLLDDIKVHHDCQNIKNKASSTPTYEEHDAVTEGSGARNRYERLGLSIGEREAIGRAAKLLIDHGRVEFLRECGLQAKLVRYVDQQVTLENVALVAYLPL
ncbi:tRNA:m(4)X modification enzyme TRM13 homolog [Hyalella azteca]|uniref:tRNA:m(4)X modification enzyme TRM13 n=1 Tax=Hyalella azteca TaxID=294128 RepID=A0A8B7PLH3_HYAAZ|nr:tRNA:m(4)X modification enzyme TRM13 homolog [Hyalella azteca]